MKNRLTIPAVIGDAVLKVIEGINGGQECHIVIIAVPVEDDGKVGQPSFCTSLQPEEMDDLVTQIAGGLAVIDKTTRKVTDKYEN